jgi:hypothetical protein|tara:strand:+ start:9709 stop:9963 length:255 start_codon:yes stop_codon:yes gene_type:complete
MSKIFRGPTYKYRPGREYDLWFVSYPIGKSVVKDSGVWKTMVVPQDSKLATYDRVLRGGYDNVITDDEATELTAAGYGDYIFNV